eukprot:9496410-Pyramimonas_sp.AAC.1
MPGGARADTATHANGGCMRWRPAPLRPSSIAHPHPVLLPAAPSTTSQRLLHQDATPMQPTALWGAVSAGPPTAKHPSKHC